MPSRGVPLGAVQAFLLRDRLARAWVWAAVMPLLWALGWTVTAAAGVGVSSQYAVFGAFGAITVMALSGVLLDARRRPSRAIPTTRPAHRHCLAATSTAAGRRAWLAGLTTGLSPDPAEDQTSGLVQAERLVGVTGLLFGAARTASPLIRAAHKRRHCAVAA